MATNVEFRVPGHHLRRAERAVAFTVNRDGRRLGTLWIAKGKVEWAPKNARSGYKMDWAKLDTLMQRHGWR